MAPRFSRFSKYNPEKQRKAVSRVARRNARLHIGLFDPDVQEKVKVLGGAAQGKINAENGHMRLIQPLGCSPGGIRGSHVRWHVNEGKKPRKFCRICGFGTKCRRNSPRKKRG